MTNLHKDTKFIKKQKRIPMHIILLATIILGIFGYGQAWASVTGQYLTDHRPTEMIYLSLTQVGQNIQGSILLVSAKSRGEIESNQLGISGIADGDIMTLTLSPSGIILQGNKRGRNITIDFPSNGQITTSTFTPTDAKSYSALIVAWKSERKIAYEQQETILLSKATMEETIRKIKETGLPLTTTNLNKSFKNLEKSIVDMRQVSNTIITATEKVHISCDKIYGQLKVLFYDSLYHGIYYGNFSDSVREYNSASQEILARVKNGQNFIEQLPIEYQAWKDSMSKSGFTPSNKPSQDDIEIIISNYKKQIEIATTARETSIQKARSLHAEGEDIYQRTSKSYEGAEKTCR